MPDIKNADPSQVDDTGHETISYQEFLRRFHEAAKTNSGKVSYATSIILGRDAMAMGLAAMLTQNPKLLHYIWACDDWFADYKDRKHEMVKCTACQRENCISPDEHSDQSPGGFYLYSPAGTGEINFKLTIAAPFCMDCALKHQDNPDELIKYATGLFKNPENTQMFQSIEEARAAGIQFKTPDIDVAGVGTAPPEIKVT